MFPPMMIEYESEDDESVDLDQQDTNRNMVKPKQKKPDSINENVNGRKNNFMKSKTIIGCHLEINNEPNDLISPNPQQLDII